VSCECLNRIDGKLADGGHNTKLDRTFVLSGPRAGMYPVIQTKLVEKKRGAKPLAVVPTFCPFCGVKYPTAEESKEPQSP
jgi:hypothetical protein